jgi:2-polyprenyl-6-methoxyphenol hydroxylase-like FAD-dependent oxidoreductase
MNTTAALDTDVLVVGAGPVGVMAAGELTRRGVSVRIIDRASERSPQSRALVVHARTLETLDLAGLADDFVAAGYPSPGLNIGLGGRLARSPSTCGCSTLATRSCSCCRSGRLKTSWPTP